MRLECDFPYPGESFPLGELVSFIEQAQAGGAAPDAPVHAVLADNDDTMVVALRVELDPPVHPAERPSQVRLSVEEVTHAIDVLEAIEDNDGDARVNLAAVRELRRLLTDRALK